MATWSVSVNDNSGLNTIIVRPASSDRLEPKHVLYFYLAQHQNIDWLESILASVCASLSVTTCLW